MPRDYKVYLDDIIEGIERIRDYTTGLSFETFSNDRKTVDAVNCNLAIIGEAVNRIPEEIKTKYPNMEWYKIIGLRNILIHDYFRVDLEIIWDIIENKLSLLEKQVKEMYQG
ncbi:MAG: DUF86 domain-containing protein [Deltaproteobacteria bacterium]|nr:DUF86 domain-containing protein [Deltaproteobacteria bacterium]